MHSISQRCNALQCINALTCHAANTPSLVINFLSHAGMSISSTSTRNMVDSLRKKHLGLIRHLAQRHKAAFAYDNLDFNFPTSEPTVEKSSTFWNCTTATILPLNWIQDVNDLRVSAQLWNSSSLNPDNEDSVNPHIWLQLYLPPDE